MAPRPPVYHRIARALYRKGGPNALLCTCEVLVEALTTPDLERAWKAHRFPPIQSPASPS